MNLLLIASRTKRWTPWNYTRTALNFLFGIGFCLVSLIQLNDDNAWAFQNSPWVLPSIFITFFTVLILNDLPHPPKKHPDGRMNSRDAVRGMGHRSGGDHDKTDPAVSTIPAQGTGNETRPHSGMTV